MVNLYQVIWNIPTLIYRVFPRSLQPAVATSCNSDRPAVNFIAGWKNNGERGMK